MGGVFFFNDTATTEIYTLSLHDALPILLGYLSGGATYGTGYDEAKSLVTGGETHSGFAIMKLLATAVSYLSGIPGGIFAPSLAVGAGLGAELHALIPYTPFAAVVMLGMVGYFTGVVQTPITALVIVMEIDRKSTRLNSSHTDISRMPSSA